MRAAIYGATGRISQIAMGPQDSIEDILQIGEQILEVSDTVSGATHYIDGGVPVAFPEQPGSAFVWDWNTKTWADPRTLQDHKNARMAILKKARNTFLNGGFTWDGSTFDSDQVSQTRLLGLKVKAQGEPSMGELWRLADNSWRALDAADALAIWDAFETHLRGAFTTFATLEYQVNAATTVEQIEGVVWP